MAMVQKLQDHIEQISIIVVAGVILYGLSTIHGAVSNNSLDIRELTTKVVAMESQLNDATSDRYTGADAERDLNVVNRRIERLEDGGG